MSKPDLNNPHLWDKLFDFLFSCDVHTTDRDVQDDLREAGIDMKSAFARMQEMIEQARARERLAAAPQRRASLLERVKDTAASHITDLREAVRLLIERAAKGQEQAAYFHKLETTATDEDLRSLLHDLELLAHLRNEAEGNGDAKAE